MSLLPGIWQRPEVLESILDQLSDALIVCDEQLRVTGVNQAAERLFDRTAAGLVGKQCREILSCDSCKPDCAILEGPGESSCLPSGNLALQLDSGLIRSVLLKTVPLYDPDGRLTGVVATLKEITDQDHPARFQIVAESEAMRELLRFVDRVSASEAASILIEGESGTGKDVIAKTLHYRSARQSEPFLAINCAAIPETLLESELFGYEKGAFTDAKAQKRGLFELADNGTLFLDEVGEIPVALQAKLLRVLEEQSFRRLGGVRDIRVDVRIIAATNRNLREAVKEGAFRQDLYYRLNVIQLVVPPLRERPDDILPLARFFVDHYNNKFKRQVDGVSPEAERLMLAYDWPGNVRELRNAIERAMILEDTGSIGAASLPIALRTKDAGDALFEHVSAASMPGQDNGMSLADQERRLVMQALESAGGNQTHAARLLRITRDTLRYKMKKFNLH